MRRVLVIPFALLLSLLLSACAGSPSTRLASVAPVSLSGPAVADSNQVAAEGAGQEADEGTRTDAQGAVTVSVTPLNLGAESATLDFEVSLETHSVDLSMDLAALAMLATDAGRTVSPVRWDAPLGGHHVVGTLSFPAEIDSTALLDGATRLTLTINGVDAPQRVFAWDLPPAN